MNKFLNIFLFPLANWPWWIYVLGIILLSATGSVIARSYNIYAHKKKNPYKKVILKGGGILEFNRYGGLDKLHKLNSDIIPSSEEWSKLNYSQEKDKIHELKGASIIVPKKSNNESLSTSSTSDVNISQLQNKIIELKNSKITLETEKSELKKQLTIKDSEINKLDQENSVLTDKITRLEAQIKGEDNNKVLLSEYKDLETRYNSLLALNKKIVPVDFLKNDAEALYIYLIYCKEVEGIAGKYFRTVKSDANASTKIACLLQKFRDSIWNLPVGDWLQILKDIQDTGISVNKEVIRIISQPEDNREKQREFRKTLLGEVIVSYSSNVLILAESFRNLTRFGIEADDAELDFGKYVAGIVSKAKTIDLDIKYVPLFEKYDKYAARVESMNRSRSFPYSEVRDLQRDDIVEIISYGVKTEFDDTKTQIIIA
jgi:hypothetical protein